MKDIKENITTLGCPKNTVDSSHLMKSLVSEGLTCTDDSSNADILIVNTCGFIRDAKEESIEEILRLANIRGSDKKLFVFGCLAKRYKTELLREIPEIDKIWGVNEEDSIIKYCKGLIKGKVRKNQKREEEKHLSSYAYLKITDGCDKKCTFCAIPSIKGRLRSIVPEEILKEAEEYVRLGTREIVLVGQNITRYGKGLGSYNLVTLLKELCALNGDFHIRLLYLYPTEISEELREFIAGEEKIYKYLDIPLQHSEDNILRLMGRKGNRNEYLRLIKELRQGIPGIALRTTFIVGFPGETEKEFKGLVDFIEETGFDRLGVFKYSREEGTSASRLKGQVNEKGKNRRFDEIMRRQALISLQKNMELLGKRCEAIIDEIDNDIAIGRLYSHAPEIDGVVIIDKNGLQDIKSKPDVQTPIIRTLRAGDTVTVEITEAFDYDLRARLI